MSNENKAHPDWIMNGRKAAEWLGIAPSTFSERGYRPVERSGKEALYDVRSLIEKEAVMKPQTVRSSITMHNAPD